MIYLYQGFRCRIIDRCEDGSLVIAVGHNIFFVQPSWVKAARPRGKR